MDTASGAHVRSVCGTVERPRIPDLNASIKNATLGPSKRGIPHEMRLHRTARRPGRSEIRRDTDPVAASARSWSTSARPASTARTGRCVRGNRTRFLNSPTFWGGISPAWYPRSAMVSGICALAKKSSGSAMWAGGCLCREDRDQGGDRRQENRRPLACRCRRAGAGRPDGDLRRRGHDKMRRARPS